MIIKIYNLKLDIDFSFFVLIGFLLYFNKEFFLASFFSYIVHEMGHVIALLYFGQNIKKIELSAFSFKIIKSSNSAMKISETLFTTISGPLFNLMAFLLLYIFYLNYINYNVFLKIFYKNNFFLFLLNVLPVKNLDGGQLFYCFLIQKTDVGVALKVLEIFSILFLIPITAIGLIILLKNKYNFSLLTLCIYLLFLLIFKKNTTL